jgi:hypothetical protein
MGEIENVAMRIFNAYEDYYLDEERRKIFEELFDKFLAPVDAEGKAEPYEVMLLLGERSRSDFDRMVKILRDHSLIP